MTEKQEQAVRWFMQNDNARLDEGNKYKIVEYEKTIKGRVWFAVAVFYNNAGKPAHLYRYQSEERRQEFIDNVKDNVQKREAEKQRRRQERKEFHTGCEVGDIFVSTWGWEQTNVDFYVLIDLKGNRGTFQEIGSSMVEGSMMSHGMACDVVPCREHEKGEPFVKQIGVGEVINLETYMYCKKWDGRPEYNSWYA